MDATSSRTARKGIFASALAVGIPFLIAGCQQPQAVLIDYSSSPMRFVVDHHGWPRPFRTPRVTEFAIANDKDELVWQLSATEGGGADARGLAIAYGEVPKGFQQLFPAQNERPKELVKGRTYFVAAGAAATVYRMVFSLPMDAIEVKFHPQTTSAPQ